VSESSKKINLGFRVSPERQEELKIVSARRRQSLQRMLEEGLDLLIKERPNSEPARSDAAKDVRWHELLDVVLIDGTQKQKEWLTGNLQTFAELIRRIKAEASSSESPEESRLLTDFRSGSYNQRQRMLAEGAKNQDLGPEVMPSSKRPRGASLDNSNQKRHRKYIR